MKNKILSTDDILKILKKYKYKAPKNRKKINKYLIGKKISVSYSKRNYTIDGIDYDKNPKTQTCSYDNKTVTLQDYFSQRYDIEIKV